MVNSEIVNIVRRYLSELPSQGIHPVSAVLFGSYARGDSHEWSDIDVLVIAPEFDDQRPIPLSLATSLWTTARKIDLRLEAVPCGVKEWNNPHVRPILAAAEKEGMEVAA